MEDGVGQICKSTTGTKILEADFFFFFLHVPPHYYNSHALYITVGVYVSECVFSPHNPSPCTLYLPLFVFFFFMSRVNLLFPGSAILGAD